jgi:hypothetical protein
MRIVLKLEHGQIHPAHPLPKGVTIVVRDYDILESRPEEGPDVRTDTKGRRYILYEMGTGEREYWGGILEEVESGETKGPKV